MKIHEYQAKELFGSYGIPVPKGAVATTPAEVRANAARLGGTVAIKAQVHVGGRGKAGGIKIAGTPDEADLAKDPDNLYLWRMPSRRMEGEIVRDSRSVEPSARIAVLLHRGRVEAEVTALFADHGGGDGLPLPASSIASSAGRE